MVHRPANVKLKLNLCICNCQTATVSSYTGPQLSSFLCDFCTCGSPKTSLLASPC